MVVPDKWTGSAKAWRNTERVDINRFRTRASPIDGNDTRIRPKSQCAALNQKGMDSLTRPKSLVEKVMPSPTENGAARGKSNADKKQRKPSLGRGNIENTLKSSASEQDMTSRSANLGFPSIAKAKSTENIATAEELQSRMSESEDRSKGRSFVRAEVSPLVNRRILRIRLGEQVLPSIQSLKKRDRRKSKSLQELSLQQKMSLQQILRNSHPSYSIDDAFWSQHWLQTRTQLLRRERDTREYNHTIEKGNHSKEPAPVDINDLKKREESRRVSNEEVQTVMEGRSENVEKELSLEDRLLLIEKLHGLSH